MPIDKELLKNAVAGFGVTPEDTALERFDLYARLLTEKNKVMNLTAVDDERGIVLKHFADSASLLSVLSLKGGQRVLDVGTGGGLPGVALLILNPSISLTLMDATKKKLDFLADTLAQLGLSAELVHLRAEDAGRSPAHREQYGAVTARAVSAMNRLCELCLPLVKVGGVFAAMKGADAHRETEEARKAIQTLGGTLNRVHAFELEDIGRRGIVLIDKTAPTPSAYPRAGTRIAKNPL